MRKKEPKQPTFKPNKIYLPHALEVLVKAVSFILLILLDLIDLILVVLPQFLIIKPFRRLGMKNLIVIPAISAVVAICLGSCYKLAPGAIGGVFAGLLLFALLLPLLLDLLEKIFGKARQPFAHIVFDCTFLSFTRPSVKRRMRKQHRERLREDKRRQQQPQNQPPQS